MLLFVGSLLPNVERKNIGAIKNSLQWTVTSLYLLFTGKIQ